MAGRHLVGISEEMMLPKVPTLSWGTQHPVTGRLGASQQDGGQTGTEAGGCGGRKGSGPEALLQETGWEGGREARVRGTGCCVCQAGEQGQYRVGISVTVHHQSTRQGSKDTIALGVTRLL